MDIDIAGLDALCKDSEAKSVNDASSPMGEQPGAGLLTIQIKAGGGALIMRDIAETERTEASLFLSSLRVRWADAQRDLDDLEKSSMTLFETWKAYETVGPQLWLCLCSKNKYLTHETLNDNNLNNKKKQ